LQKTGKIPWPAQMKKEDITLLEVVWYETFNDETKGIPTPEGQVYKISSMKTVDCQDGM
jgi:hypothetical protein